MQEFSLPSRELEDGTARCGEGRVPRRRAVSPREVHRDEPDSPEPRGGAVLQQARDARAVDQGRQASGEDEPLDLPPVPV